MRTRLLAVTSFIALGVAAAGAEPAARQDAGAAETEQAEVHGQKHAPPATPTEQFEAIRAEWEAVRTAAVEARKAAGAPAEKRAVFSRLKPDSSAYARRFLALAEAHPDDLGARDALLWIVMRETLARRAASPASLGIAPPSDVLNRAVDLLIEHHFNDLDVARTALCLENHPSSNRDRLFRALYEKAGDRVVKGPAALALAQYLDLKSKAVGGAFMRKNRAVSATLFTEEYELHLRSSDPEALKAEAVRLLELVIADFADIPYVRGGRMTDSARDLNWRALTEWDLGRKWTLAQAAEERRDEILNIAVGKPAPEIDGVGFDGNPLKLSDYRGKVVVLVFWGTWCGPCRGEVPHERELVERLKGHPFALVGVDCEDDKEVARKAIQKERMTWPNWYDGAPDEGPISARYHVKGFPSIFVLDAKGIIRYKKVRGQGIDQAVDTLLKEMNQPAPANAGDPRDVRQK